MCGTCGGGGPGRVAGTLPLLTSDGQGQGTSNKSRSSACLPERRALHFLHVTCLSCQTPVHASRSHGRVTSFHYAHYFSLSLVSRSLTPAHLRSPLSLNEATAKVPDVSHQLPTKHPQMGAIYKRTRECLPPIREEISAQTDTRSLRNSNPK